MRVPLRDGHYLHVRVHGEGSPDILLIHGWVVSGEVWQPVIDRWPARGAGRLLVVDLRGTGWSGKPATGYAPDDFAADLGALIDAMSLQDLVVVGHSLGGQIAQRVAADRPDAVARLVLLCPVPASGVPITEDQAAFFHGLCDTYEGARQLVGMMIARQPPQEALERLVLSASATSHGAFHESFDAWRKARFADRLADIAAPTTVIGCEADPALPPALLREAVVPHIRGAVYVEIPGVGHYPQIEAPDQLTELLRHHAGV